MSLTKNYTLIPNIIQEIPLKLLKFFLYWNNLFYFLKNGESSAFGLSAPSGRNLTK